MKEEKDDVDESAAPLIEHLTELRSRLIRSVVAFALCMILAFTVATHIFNFLANPIVDILKENGQSPDLIFTGLQHSHPRHPFLLSSTSIPTYIKSLGPPLWW